MNHENLKNLYTDDINRWFFVAWPTDEARCEELNVSALENAVLSRRFVTVERLKKPIQNSIYYRLMFKCSNRCRHAT